MNRFFYIFFLHPKIMKSISSVILKLKTSGVATTTLGNPPNFFNFASTSPNVLEHYKIIFI